MRASREYGNRISRVNSRGDGHAEPCVVCGCRERSSRPGLCLKHDQHYRFSRRQLAYAASQLHASNEHLA